MDGQKINYQLEMEKTIGALTREGKRPRLLLHSCCAPCSSHVLSCLAQHFQITIFYYNPNISPQSEFEHRAKEQIRLIREMNLPDVQFQIGDYEPEVFFEMAKGMEDLPEGSERCFACYRQRMEKTAQMAKAGGFDYFTTTLSVSPHKNATVLNEIGQELQEKHGVLFLCADFKKKNGYQHSIALSKQYHLYRQNYCGCVFSKR